MTMILPLILLNGAHDAERVREVCNTHSGDGYFRDNGAEHKKYFSTFTTKTKLKLRGRLRHAGY